MLNSKIENLIDELPQASNKRVEEIVTILEGVLSDIECNIPIEDDSDRAYKCQNISKAQDILVLIRAWNSKSEDRESEIEINKLSNELKITFSQI
jgi:hypothetical protein